MGFFGILLLVVFIIVCLLLIFLVIVQDEDADSIGGIFASGSQSAFGSRSSNVVIRITYVLGALFFVTAFALAVVNKTSTGNVQQVVQQNQTQSTSSDWWNGQNQAAPTGQTQNPAAPQTSAPQDQTTPQPTAPTSN